MKNRYERLFSLIREKGYEIKHTSLVEDKLNLVVRVKNVEEKQNVRRLVDKNIEPDKKNVDLHIIY